MKKLAIETLGSSSKIHRTNCQSVHAGAKYRWTCLLAGALLWIGSTATNALAVATHTSSFTDADQSWVGTNSDTQFGTGGAVDNAGYLGVFRNGGDPIANANGTTHDNTNLSGAFVGDLLARYGGGLGNQMEISFYHKYVNGSINVNSNSHYLALQFSNGANNFLINPPNYPVTPPALSSTEWRLMTLTVNLDWTDVQASAAGWTKTGTMTWANLMQNATGFRIQTWDVEGSSQQLGLDEITFATVPVPEPNSALLFVMGAIVLTNRRWRAPQFRTIGKRKSHV